MTLDFESLVLAPNYAVFGVTLEFKSPKTAAAVSLPAIDMTAGVEVPMGAAQVPTIRPAAMVRASDLAAARLAKDDMRGVCVTLAGKVWKVETTRPKPGPQGEGKGEVMLILSEQP